MTTKEKIMKIIALAVSIEPTATRFITLDYSGGRDRVSIYVFSSHGIVENFDYYADREDLYCSYDDAIRKLTDIKNNMDAERNVKSAGVKSSV